MPLFSYFQLRLVFLKIPNICTQNIKSVTSNRTTGIARGKISDYPTFHLELI